MALNKERRDASGVSRQYRSADILVNWEPEYCIHSARCWRNLPAVFDPQARPWVKADAAGTDEIAWVVGACPSGALSFERLDGGPAEPVPETASVEPQADGPLYFRGRIRIVDSQGNVVREATRAALCRCGHSQNKPFCDLCHLRAGFSAE